MLRLFVPFLLCLGLTVTGCASTPGATQSDRLAALTAFTVRDLTTATAIATTGGDKAGALCLGYLAQKATALAAKPATPPPDLSLPISDLERIRVAIHAQSTGPGFLADLDFNCSALRTSLEIDLAKGALLVGGLVGSGGASAPGDVAKVLPILMRLLRPGQ